MSLKPRSVHQKYSFLHVLPKKKAASFNETLVFETLRGQDDVFVEVQENLL